MKGFELLKRAVTLITLALLTIYIFSQINLFPYALIGFGIYCLLKSKEYFDNKSKGKAAAALICGLIIVAVILSMILR